MAKTIVVPGSTQSLYEHSPGIYRPFPPVSNTLYSVLATPPAYVGGFVVTPDPSGTSDLTYTQDAHRIAWGSAANRMFLTGHNWGEGGQPHLGEATIPALVGGSDVNAFNVGTIVQPFKNIKTDMAGFQGDATISGMEYDRTTHPLDPSRTGTGQLAFGTYSYYAGYSGKNFGLYRVGSNLASSADFNTDMTGGAHFSGMFIKIPAEWRSSFGNHTHWACNGIGMAIVGRASNGPSLLAFTMPEVGESPVSISGTVVMDYPLATPLCDTEAEMNTAQIWNHVSRLGGGFCIPNTDTIMFIGSNWDKRVGGTIDYKGTNDIGQTSNGYDPSLHNAFANYYWLYDINDIAAVYANSTLNPPHLVRPYEHGFFPTFPNTNWQRRITGAYYDYSTDRMVTSLFVGSAARWPGLSTPSFAVHQIL